MTDAPLRILTMQEAAALLRVHKSTLQLQVKAGTIPAAKIGRAWTFIESDLVAHMRSQYTGDAPCHSINKKTATTGGRTSTYLATPGYADQLENLIASRRKKSTTS